MIAALVVNRLIFSYHDSSMKQRGLLLGMTTTAYEAKKAHFQTAAE
jgi:hypothetical protein